MHTQYKRGLCLESTSILQYCSLVLYCIDELSNCRALRSLLAACLADRTVAQCLATSLLVQELFCNAHNDDDSKSRAVGVQQEVDIVLVTTVLRPSRCHQCHRMSPQKSYKRPRNHLTSHHQIQAKYPTLTRQSIYQAHSHIVLHYLLNSFLMKDCFIEDRNIKEILV